MSGVPSETLQAISTPDRVESRLGTLEFNDGAPSEATATLLYDHLDFVHGVEAFIGAYPAASLEAMRQGFLSIGVEDNAVLVFSELMDSASLFLTANCDTVYFISLSRLHLPGARPAELHQQLAPPRLHRRRPRGTGQRPSSRRTRRMG